MSYELSERYNFNAFDLELLAAASTLLKKLAATRKLQYAEMVSVAKLQHVLSCLPRVTCGLDIKVSVQSPHHKFGETETSHWWQVAIEGEQLSISSGGYFYRPSTGGDSFSTMSWAAVLGEWPTDFNDYSSSLSLVPDVRSFPDGIATIDFESESYNVEVYDRDNPLLDEMEDDNEDDYSTEDNECSLEEDHEDFEPQQPWTVTPQDDLEKLLASTVDPAEVDNNEPQYAYGVKSCDFCGCSINACGVFVDGSLHGPRAWGNMCARCFNDKGAGVGWGKGQLFAKQQDGNWRLVAGFRT